MAKSYDEIYKEEEKKLEESKKKQQDTINEIHDSRAKVVNDQYNTAVENTRLGYESDYERNAVQKYINEKQIAERNANLGLTDSGLNRTQQTAAQLSYANQKGDIDLAKRKALDTLSQNLAATMVEIEQSRKTSLAELEASYDAQAQSNAANRYNAEISAVPKYSGGVGVINGGGSDTSGGAPIRDDAVVDTIELGGLKLPLPSTYDAALLYLKSKNIDCDSLMPEIEWKSRKASGRGGAETAYSSYEEYLQAYVSWKLNGR